jgi:hypothetical protein
MAAHRFARAWSALVPATLDSSKTAWVSSQRANRIQSATLQGHAATHDGTAIVTVSSLRIQTATAGCQQWRGSYQMRRQEGRWLIVRADITPSSCPNKPIYATGPDGTHCPPGYGAGNPPAGMRAVCTKGFGTASATDTTPEAPETNTAAPSTTPKPQGCYPLASSGNCYEPGEYCSDADHGMTGVAGDGESIACEDNDGWRWEPS